MGGQEIHIHIHSEQPAGEILQSPPHVHRGQQGALRENTRARTIKDSMAQTWWRREMHMLYREGYPIWQKLHGSQTKKG